LILMYDIQGKDSLNRGSESVDLLWWNERQARKGDLTEWESKMAKTVFTYIHTHTHTYI
jgi:hypothetical protein